jgi:hypothetical protein
MQLRQIRRSRVAGVQILAGALVAALLLAGCTGKPPAQAPVPEVRLAEASEDPRRLTGDGLAGAVEMSRALFAASPVAVVIAGKPEGGPRTPAARRAALDLGVPMLPAAAKDLDAELERLGVRTLVTFGEPDGGWEAVAGDREVHAGPVQAEDLPVYVKPGEGAPALVLTPLKLSQRFSTALATAEAAGAVVERVREPDPRATADNIALLREHAGKSVIAVGPGFGRGDRFSHHVQVALHAPQLPGDGQLVFPGRRMVALYGHPRTNALGVLGEHDVEGAVRRAKKLAARYRPFSDEPVIPAFEIIATVASSGAGRDGDYSSEATLRELRPWVDAAEAAGVYVVLDLQPGRSNFLAQAKRYEELLARPHVGLALDPEWRIGRGQLHMEQIGSVDAAEINKVSRWLAQLTRENQLPQKVLLLHQFNLDMIANRDQLELGHSELATVLHADGHGNPGNKVETYNALQDGLSRRVWMGWKNFIDEDSPTFTPEQTYTGIEPKPWFVSYQ